MSHINKRHCVLQIRSIDTCESEEEADGQAYDPSIIEVLPRIKKDDLKCPICNKIQRVPYLTCCCGKECCKNCILPLQMSHKPCPFCEESLLLTVHDKHQHQLLNCTLVQCPDCEKWRHQTRHWSGKLEKLDEHRKGEQCQLQRHKMKVQNTFVLIYIRVTSVAFKMVNGGYSAGISLNLWH